MSASRHGGTDGSEASGIRGNHSDWIDWICTFEKERI